MSAAIEIRAPAARVWSILADLERYGEWNPMTPSVQGTLAVGQTLRLTAELGGFQRSQDQRVDAVEPGRRIVWSGGLAADLVRGTRTQTIEPLGSARCRYTTEDRFRGPLAPATRATMTRVLNARFRAVAAALRDRAEGWDRPVSEDGRWVVVGTAAGLPTGAVRAAVVEGRLHWLWRTEGGRTGAVEQRKNDGQVTVLGEHLHTEAGPWGVADPGTRPALQVGPLVVLWLQAEGLGPAWWPRISGPWNPAEDWRRWRVAGLPVGAALDGLGVEERAGERALVLEKQRGVDGRLTVAVAPPAPSSRWAEGGMGRLARAALRWR